MVGGLSSIGFGDSRIPAKSRCHADRGDPFPALRLAEGTADRGRIVGNGSLDHSRCAPGQASASTSPAILANDGNGSRLAGAGRGSFSLDRKRIGSGRVGDAFGPIGSESERTPGKSEQKPDRRIYRWHATRYLCLRWPSSVARCASGGTGVFSGLVFVVCGRFSRSSDTDLAGRGHHRRIGLCFVQWILPRRDRPLPRTERRSARLLRVERKQLVKATRLAPAALPMSLTARSEGVKCHKETQIPPLLSLDPIG